MNPLRLESVRLDIADRLEDMRADLFTEDMLLTLVARHPMKPECFIVVSADDVGKVAELLRKQSA